MPGHKGGRGAPARGLELLGAAAYEADVSEMGGFDYLHGATSALVVAQQQAADVFSADRTFFLVGGATAGNLAAIFATCADGDEIVIARGSHRSVYAALVISGATPRYLAPVPNEAMDGLFGVDPAELGAVLQTHPGIRAVHVTSPSYYGFTSPIAEIAAITHAHGLPLIVDEAHGSHFSFHDALPPPALAEGADAVIQSPHKTLGSLTQSSLLHLKGSRLDASRIDQALQMLQSSSPSALLLLSLDFAISEMHASGPARWSRAIAIARRIRSEVATIDTLHLYGDDVIGVPGIYGYDPTKLVVDVSRLQTTGQAAAAWLRRTHQLHPEFADLRRIVFSITTGDDDIDADLLIDALRGLPSVADGLTPARDLVALWPRDAPDMQLSPRQGFNQPAEPVSIECAVGRVAGEMIVPYPPGIPLVVPGEVLSSGVLDTLSQLLSAGCKVVGMADPSGRSLRCVREIRR